MANFHDGREADSAFEKDYSQRQLASPVDRRRCHIARFLPWVALSTLLLIALGAFGHEFSLLSIESSPHAALKHTCGSTVAEAKAKGCVFDVMAYGWVPSQCYNGDLVSTYNAYDMSPWAFDRNFTKPATEQVLMAGERRILYTDLRFHQEHCFYTWHNLLHSVEHQRPLIHNLSASTEHRHHCKGLFLHGEAPTGPVVPAFFHCVDMEQPFLLREHIYAQE
ncbi:hypothetical protein CORC01_12784 [Colletotrichum orchidophilum]|uniref:Uncharacterized protein n=1 Tax=Colletotrichum orchidophilum TaxID=1209926 RepID=A0A1G4ARY3_9PEZI|nr:uncharacterized protein CORC01_12784 [Colletotrichum orchidophilum]OHE91934.1 hypothetical protein CORC01_12784 [Colletotrichum orchidophilum]